MLADRRIHDTLLCSLFGEIEIQRIHRIIERASLASKLLERRHNEDERSALAWPLATKVGMSTVMLLMASLSL